ncbi:MAG: energy-coupling factor ABC transporter ATP-binding protein [Dehalococcoidia bacterium]|nr:Cobalt import ATP-binding protein CbiO [Chloroflexota bacterium]MBT9159128.1 Cobalt import ATP-binding protein CbiO [Chloroflexota bacterium]
MREKVVSINSLSYAYPDGTQALKGISLDIFRGECLGLIGPNGSGKTTFVLHLNGIFLSENNNGTVTIMGRKIGKENVKAIRKNVGIVFQDPDAQLFMPTVFDDVAFGPINLGYDKADVKQRVAQALTSVGMEGFEERVPHHLSMGQKKRISIATVLSMSPEILVLDEPSANLDPGGKWSLIETVREFSMTKIVVSHDMELVQALCERTVILDDGQIVADDLTENILSNMPLLRAHGLATLCKLGSRRRN